MPSVVDRVVSVLQKHEGVSFTSSSREVSVPAAGADGFTVTLTTGSDARVQVAAEGWRETFSRAEDAYDCFLLLLSDRSRLKVTLRGATPVGWQIETRAYGQWVPGRHVRRRLVPVWRRVRIERRQNRVFLSENDSGP